MRYLRGSPSELKYDDKGNVIYHEGVRSSIRTFPYTHVEDKRETERHANHTYEKYKESFSTYGIIPAIRSR